jgi:hypothetical protein
MNPRRYMETHNHSARRFAWYFALAGLSGALLGLFGELLSWSDRVSFAATLVVGTAISMAALRENPLDWFRGSREGRRTGRRPSA